MAANIRIGLFRGTSMSKPTTAASQTSTKSSSTDATAENSSVSATINTFVPEVMTSKRRSSSSVNKDVTPVSTPQSQKRRSSTRSIKRKKFDDELVESSLTPSQPKIEKIIKAKAQQENKSSTSSVSTPSITATTISPSVTSASSLVTSSSTDTTTVTSSPTKTVKALFSAGPSPPSGSKNASTPSTQSITTTDNTVDTDKKSGTTTQPVTTDVELSPVSTTTVVSSTKGLTTIKTTPLTISVPELEKAAAALEASEKQQQQAQLPTSATPTITPASSTADLLTPKAVTPTLPSPSHSDRRKRESKGSSSKRSKKAAKPPPAASTKDLGRWKPQDDLLLITAVQQTCDLTAVYLGCKFSCKFTLREIQERWYALLYDPVLSKLAIQAMGQLHQDVITQVETQALYSKEEESMLGTIASNHFHNSQPNLNTFEAMLNANPNTFHPTRTAKCLQTHWLLMRQYHLLPDQTVQPMPKGDHVLNFSDAEDMINDDELRDENDEELEHELSVADRRQKKEIRHLEAELPKWQVLVDSVTGISPQEFDNQTLAVLRGRLVRYLMRSKEITLGRSTKENPIDVDLTLEGPAWKISRRQGVIKLKNNGDFYIANEGKRPIYVDGKPIIRGAKHKLNNNSVVELSCLRFIFLINTELISIIRQDSQKIHST